MNTKKLIDQGYLTPMSDSEMYNTNGGGFAEVIEAIGSAIADVINAIANVIGAIGEAIGNLAEAVGEGLDAIRGVRNGMR